MKRRPPDVQCPEDGSAVSGVGSGVVLPEHENLCGVVRGAVVGLQIGALDEGAAGDLEAPAADVGDDAGGYRRIQIPGLARGVVAEPAVPLLYRRPVGVLAIDDV